MSLCRKKPISHRLKQLSSTTTLVNSLFLSLLESHLLLWPNLLASASPRRATLQLPTVDCPPRLMPTNPPALIVSSLSPTIQPLRLAIQLKRVQSALLRNKEGRARRGSERLTRKRRRLANIARSPALLPPSLISSLNLCHHHYSLHLLPCNHPVLARISCHQMSKLSQARDHTTRSPHLLNLQACTMAWMVSLLPPSSGSHLLVFTPDLEETTKTCVV